MRTQQILLNRVIFILAVLGVIMALYVLQSFLRDAPIYCVTSGCETVRKSQASKLYGLPVPAYGLIGYTLIAITSFLYTLKPSKLLATIISGIGIFGVMFVSWFTYTEAFVIKAFCMWCTISAVNMCILTGVSVLLYRKHQKQ